MVGGGVGERRGCFFCGEVEQIPGPPCCRLDACSNWRGPAVDGRALHEPARCGGEMRSGNTSAYWVRAGRDGGLLEEIVEGG